MLQYVNTTVTEKSQTEILLIYPTKITKIYNIHIGTLRSLYIIIYPVSFYQSIIQFN
jgi:hypothetical protein